MAITKDELATHAKELFDALDADKSGFLEKAELRTLAGQLHAKMSEGNPDAKPFNEEKFEEGFAKVDKSGDGKLSFEEVLNVLVNFATNRGFLKE